MDIAIVLVCAFLLGSLLGAQILGRIKGIDLRQSGSGNLGATNALRSEGTASGISVLLFDVTKAVLAVYLALSLVPNGPEFVPWACGILVIGGHIFSPWAGFKGGKGVAAGLGACLILIPVATAWGLSGFVISIVLSGYVSLSVLLACSLIVLQVTCFSSAGIWSFAGAFSGAVFVLLCWTHRENFLRLWRGEENRFEKIMLLKPKP